VKQEFFDGDSTPPMKSASSRGTEVAAWLIILTIVALLVTVNSRRRNAAVADDPLGDLRMKVLAQEVIGARSLGLGTPKRAQAQTVRLIQQVDKEARKPEDKVRAAILVGYLQGKPAAQSRLDKLPKAERSPEVNGDIATLRTIYRDGADALAPGEADRLIGRYGYFGRMALAADAPQDSEARKAIESPALRMMLLLGAIGLGLLMLIALSLGLMVVGIVCWWNGKIHAAYSPGRAGNAAYLEAFALYLVLFLSLSLMVHSLGLVNPSWNWLAWLIIPVAMLWIANRTGSTEDWRVALGWYSGKGWLWECAAGIAGYLACLPFVAIGLVITLILVRVTGVIPRDAVTPLLQGNVVVLYGLACVFAPVIEETMFRGALFHHLRGRWGWAPSAVVVSFLFAMVHPQGWVSVPALGSIAMALAALREWRGSIIASMTAHAFNNFIVITLALALLRGNGAS
jgi:membrane protease YdiL (CAAX protease family)